MILWEILVPKSKVLDDGRLDEYRLFYHCEWDDYVDNITGGLTIMRSSQGSWRDDNGGIIKERMIPVRIACTAEQMVMIAEFTKRHYDQEKVMYYKLSDEVYFV